MHQINAKPETTTINGGTLRLRGGHDRLGIGVGARGLYVYGRATAAWPGGAGRITQ